MSHNALAHSALPNKVFTPAKMLQDAREIIHAEAAALSNLASQLGQNFCDAANLIYNTQGSVIITGMGKAGLIGQKLTATMASTGTRAHFMHPAEAFHGDLGRIHLDDVVLALSQSGESGEVVQLLPSLLEFQTPIVAVTGSETSTLARAATIVLNTGVTEEACSLGLAPTTSTTAMLALGDALSLVVSQMKGFRDVDFARFHPGGSLGRKLSTVDEQMRPISECRVASAKSTVREVLVHCSRPGRRTGAIMLLDDSGKLEGMFTDSDLARLFEGRNEHALDQSIEKIMTVNPHHVVSGSKFMEAIGKMAGKKISELPVVTKDGLPIGLLDVTDIVGQVEEVTRTVQPPHSSNLSNPNVRIFEDRPNAG